MNSSSRILHITPIGVVLSMLFLGIVEDDFFKTLFFLNGVQSTDPVYLIGHVILLLSYLTSSLVVILDVWEILPSTRIFWKKLSHRTRTWLIFGGAVTVLVLFRLLLLKFFG